MVLSTIRIILSGFTAIIITLFLSIVLHADVIDTVVAVINDDIILASELDRAINLYKKSNNTGGSTHKIDDPLAKQLRSKVIVSLIDEKIIGQEARRFGITYTPEEIDAAIEHVKELNNCSNLDGVLEYSGVSMSDLRQNLQKQILRNKFIDKHIYSRIAITDEKIRRYYNNNFHIYDGVLKYHLCSVLAKIPNPDDFNECILLFSKIFEILQELDTGSDFGYISEIYSPIENIHIEYLGSFSENELSDHIKKSVITLDVGRNSKIMKTRSGFQFFHIKDVVKTEPKSLEMVKNAIYKKLLSEQANYEFTAWLDSVKKQSNIKLFRNNL